MKQEHKISSWYGGQYVRGVYNDFFILGNKQTVEKRSPEGVPGGHNPLGRAKAAWRALVSCAHQGTLPGSFLFSYFSKYSKTDKKYFCGFFGVRLLTVSRTSLFSWFWSVPKGFFYVFFQCHSLDNISFNINGRTWDIMFYSLPINNLRVSTFDIIYFDSSRSINLLDNIGSFPHPHHLT